MIKLELCCTILSGASYLSKRASVLWMDWASTPSLPLAGRSGASAIVPKKSNRGVSTVSPFICPDCGKTYKHKITLNRHVRLECNKEPQFQCPVCPMRFKQKGHMAFYQFPILGNYVLQPVLPTVKTHQ
ncbi:longitudinals lacking protein-like isoform X3 [Thrips palmi]|uniref:Longitudinals lacking protein-like isoform X3 n=1 Tax=Thrips palmi TaxID=161013 RepID=A0A6P8ZWF3_THRPL|nr:longitudinals lacking protein-like isoform X3 [Thrips palmi]